MKNRFRNTVLFIAGSIVVAGLLGGAPSSARTTGVGELLLHSDFGQPLNTEIEIVSLQAGGEIR
jgi:Tfp pilus assembly protein FimV